MPVCARDSEPMTQSAPFAVPTRPGHVIATNPEVFYSDRAFLTVGPDDIAWLKAEAARLPRRRARLCAHPDPSAPVHEMVIVHGHMAYVRPHRHLDKAESLHVLEGTVRALLFDQDGGIVDVVDMGPLGTGRPYFYRMPQGIFHSLLISSDWLVFHEATEGPFDPARTEFPAWAPDGSDPSAVERYMADLRARAG